MGRKLKQLKPSRLYFYVFCCSVMGVVLGATASQAEINECMTSSAVDNSCLTKSPIVKKLEGMGMGLFAGAGAAIGSTWKYWLKEE
jgi:hypothetical protein